MKLRSGNEKELIPVAYEIQDGRTRKGQCSGVASQARSVNASILESSNVCTRNMSKRSRTQGGGRPKSGWLPEGEKTVPKYATIVQTKHLEVMEPPNLCTWAVKKRRTPPPNFYSLPLPSTIAGTYPQILTYLEPCLFPCQIGIQNSDKENTIIHKDEIEVPNTPPQPNTKKRKFDYFVGVPIYIVPTGDSSCKEIFRQLTWVGSNDPSAIQSQGSELVCSSENVGENQHLLVNVSPNDQSLEPNSDWCKTSTNLIDENIDSTSTNCDANLDISTQASYVDSCHREMSQPLICVANSQASALSVQGTETFCCYENVSGDQHLVADVSPKTRLFEPNGDGCKTFGNLNNENVDSSSTSEDRLPVPNSTSIASHNNSGSINSEIVSVPLTPSTPQNNIQNQLLVGNVVSNPCMLERVEQSKEKQTNLLSPELSSATASPTLGGNDVLQDKTFHLQLKDGPLAAEQGHDYEIDLNKVTSQKPKRKKHRPKILIKEGSFVKRSRSKIQFNRTAHSKLPKRRNSRGNQRQVKTPILNKEELDKSCPRKSDSSQPVTDVSSATNGETLGYSELSRFQSGAFQNNDVAVENKCHNKELISQIAYEQAKLMQMKFGNHVQSVNGGFSKIFSSSISGKRKKAKLKDLARKKKLTTSEKYAENEENGSALALQIASENPLVKVKGKRSPRKKLVSGCQNAENSLCLIDLTVQCENRSAMTVNSGTINNPWQGILAGFHSQIRANSYSYGQAVYVDNLCICKKNPHEQGHKMIPENIIQDCQNESKFLQPFKFFTDAVDAIQERLKNLSFDEDRVCSIHNRQEIIPLEMTDDLIPSAESLSLVPYKDPFETLKTKKFRPKVLLDSETKRVFNLLMGKEGVEDETDHDEAEKLEQERQTFKYRAESFIACMRVLQGNRQFSPWKGSVVDSVVGAFLTQNVSDHLSSSAYISLASRFPHPENNQGSTLDTKGLETIVLNNPSYSYVTCEVDGQSPDLPRDGNCSIDFYKGNLSWEERFSYQSKNSVADATCKVPSPHSPTSDLLFGMDGSNLSGESVHNHIFSHASGFDTNAQADLMPANKPICHCRSNLDSNFIAGIQLNESILEKSCTEHLAQTEREVSFNLQGAEMSFEAADFDITMAGNDSFQESAGSNSKAKVIESRMTNSSPLDHHNSRSQSEFFDESAILCIGPPQYQGSGLPEKDCEPIALRIHETVPDLNIASLENEPEENEMANSKSHLPMDLHDPDLRRNTEMMRVENCRIRNTTHNGGQYNSNSQHQNLDGTLDLGIEPSENQGSGLPSKTCVPVLVQKKLEDLTAVYVENKPGESEMKNENFHEKMAPNDLGLSNELPQNPRSRLPNKVCELILLHMRETVPNLCVVSIEKEKTENEVGIIKFHEEMTPEDLGLSIDLPQNRGSRLPDKGCESILLQRHETVSDLCPASAKNEPAENEMGNAKFYRGMARQDLGLSEETQVQPDSGSNAEIMELEDGWRNVPVGKNNELTCTHSDHNHNNSYARAEPSYREIIGYGFLGQEVAGFGECNNSSQALPYDFLGRPCQERCQAYAASDCQCSSLTEGSQFSEAQICSLTQEGNSGVLPNKIIPPEEFNIKLTLSSTPSNAPISNIFGSDVPKRPRSTRRSDFPNNPTGRTSHIKNLTSKTFYIKDSITKTSGIARANMEMTQGSGKKRLDWESIRNNVREFNDCAVKKERDPNSKDAVNWDAVRCADLEDIADAIKERGMNNILAGRIKSFLEMLHAEHGSIDLEWLKDLRPDDAKNFLLNVRGLGLKSVECIRLLTLQQLAFPVDTNVGRIVVRLGWVPLAPLPESLLIHKLEEYPYLNNIQQYLWPRLCTLDQRTLYELHYQMITFGKVFCHKSRPNCNACPMKLNCKHFASAFASARQALPAPGDKSLSMPISSFNPHSQQDSYSISSLALPPTSSFNILSQKNPYTLDLDIISMKRMSTSMQNYEPIIEEPPSPEHEYIDSSTESAVHESLDMDSDELQTINLNCNDRTLQIYKSSENGIQCLQATDTSTALVIVPPESASIPVPKLKNISRLRTEHQVYEIPDNHQLLSEFDLREPDDPCSYLLAIWSPAETLETTVTPEPCSTSNGSPEYRCEQESCSSCTTMRGINDGTVKGTVLIPCRTAMRGSFPLNGTYFQVNEVFADHKTSLHPIEVPRNWIWNLRRCTVYFSTSVPNIFRGLHAEAIQKCFWKGYVCVRGFERKMRAPRPLVARLHFPASKKDKEDNNVNYKKEG